MWWRKHYDLKCHRCGKVIGIVTEDNLVVLCRDCELQLQGSVCLVNAENQDIKFKFDLATESLRISKQTNKLLLEEVARRKT